MNTPKDVEIRFPTNVEEYRRLVLFFLEDEDVPRLVQSWALANEGSPLTVRNVPYGFKVNRRYGMTHIEGYGVEFFIAHSEKNVTIPSVAELRNRNKTLYEGREERNAKRKEFLASPVIPERHYLMLHKMRAAADLYKATLAEFNDTFDCETHWEDHHPDFYDLRRVVGIIEEAR